MGYAYRPFDYVAPPGLSAAEPRHSVAIIGAGPIGLCLAIDLAQNGVRSVVLDDNNVVSVGSRAICWSKRSLEIMDRLGVGERMLDKGVTWAVGRVFHGDDERYAFDLLPEEGHKYPAFINLQQYYVEEYLIDRAREFSDLIDLRFKNKVVDHADIGDHVTLAVETPDGPYRIEADYLVACDGAGSPTRERMGLSFSGRRFDENFLIVDVEMEESPFDTPVPERWFWFEPRFHPGQSALLHKQPDNIYRIDLQLGPEADPKAEASEDRVLPRIRAIVGEKPFRLDWTSVYQFRCARLDRFVHGRVIFAGDSAHVVSPFGARGGNGGIQDVDNLGWKLARVIRGKSGAALLETYQEERLCAADENILNSSRATNFMTPKSPVESMFRKEVLRLASQEDFARAMINSGRLSLPCDLGGMALQGDGVDAACPGFALRDLPLDDGSWLLERVRGGFVLVGFGDVDLPDIGIDRIGVAGPVRDYPQFGAPPGLIGDRYGMGLIYLFRPDGHVADIFDNADAAPIRQALERASGNTTAPAGEGAA